jgi:hypothetical protein
MLRAAEEKSLKEYFFFLSFPSTDFYFLMNYVCEAQSNKEIRLINE